MLLIPSSVFPVLAAAALAAPDVPQLAYVGPNAYGDPPRWTGKADPANTQLSEHAPGTTLFVATANANLRAGPDTSQAVVAKLPLGAEVVVGEAETQPVVVGQRVDRWYRVKAGEHEGHLFGSTLTPLAARLNLDGKPGDEVITVGWAWNFELVVRTGPADGSTEFH